MNKSIHMQIGIQALLISGALLVADAAVAGPREAVAAKQAEDVVVAAGDPAVWMKRLVGRFRFDGVIHHQEIIDFDKSEDAPPNPDIPGSEGEVRGASMIANEWSQSVQGKGDCIAFSDGPGLQCVDNVAWPETWRPTGKAQLGGVSDMTPAAILGGLNPSVPGEILFLLLNDKGLAHPGSLTLSGNSAIAKPPCVNLPGTQRCDQRFTITAGADARTLFVQLSVTVRFLRNKTERKLSLDMITDNRGNKDRYEKSTEWVDEQLDVSFSLRREPQPGDTQGAPSAKPPAAQGSR